MYLINCHNPKIVQITRHLKKLLLIFHYYLKTFIMFSYTKLLSQLCSKTPSIGLVILNFCSKRESAFSLGSLTLASFNFCYELLRLAIRSAPIPQSLSKGKTRSAFGLALILLFEYPIVVVSFWTCYVIISVSVKL